MRRERDQGRLLPTMLEWAGSPWLIQAGALERFAEAMGGMTVPEPAAMDAAMSDGAGSGRYGLTMAGTTAIVEVAGPLLRSVPPIVGFFRASFGLAVTGYDEIAEDVRAAAADGAVERIVLRIHSPGGTSSGAAMAREAIAAAAAVKPVTAVIQDLGCSAAYELACQAGTILAEPAALVGSIGTLIVMEDASGLYERLGVRTIVVSSGEHKGTGAAGTAITEAQVEPYQRIVDRVSEDFIATVAAGRRMTTGAVRALADGRVWDPTDAKANGLIDAIGLLETVLAGGPPAGVDDTDDEEMAMSRQSETPAADLDAARAEGAAAAASETAGRLKALTEAFSDDLAFAVEQFEAGATVEQAKAAYADVLAERVATLEAEAAALRARTAEADGAGEAASTGGADAIESEGEGGTAGGGDFRAMARALAKEEHLSIGEAQRQLAREEPALYQAYKRRLPSRADAVRAV